jgi:lipid II:glycine glycyltransferase (peptidoglycan interpeptide bridge formation enzyme)
MDKTCLNAGWEEFVKYEVCIDSLSKEQWEQCASKFTDHNLYQTWGYQQIRAQNDHQQLERVIVKDQENDIVTMCHIRIKRSTVLGLKIGYVQWGPLLGSPKINSDSLTAALKLLLSIYVGTRVNILRLVPNVSDDERGKQVSRIFESCGLTRVQSVPRYRTMILDITSSKEEIRNRLHRSWRRYLKKAEENNIEIREGLELEYFDILKKLYLSSRERKHFQGLNPEEFSQIQQLLTSREKMNVVVAYYQKEPVTAHITSHLGNTALGIMAASSEKGLNCWASYIVWWITLLSAKRAGMKIYDLAGIDPDDNPSVYQFKLRMGAKEIYHIGAFESCDNLRVKATWRMTEKAYNVVKKCLSK